jgi:hypothetical protein
MFKAVQEPSMTPTDSATHLRGTAPISALSTTTASAQDRPEPFGDFSRFQASAQVGLGQTTASIDPAHAARAVAGFLLEG